MLTLYCSDQQPDEPPRRKGIALWRNACWLGVYQRQRMRWYPVCTYADQATCADEAIGKTTTFRTTNVQHPLVFTPLKSAPHLSLRTIHSPPHYHYSLVNLTSPTFTQACHAPFTNSPKTLTFSKPFHVPSDVNILPSQQPQAKKPKKNATESHRGTRMHPTCPEAFASHFPRTR